MANSPWQYWRVYGALAIMVTVMVVIADPVPPAAVTVAVPAPMPNAVMVASGNASTTNGTMVVISSNDTIKVQTIDTYAMPDDSLDVAKKAQEDEATAIKQVLDKYVDLAAYVPPLNSTQLKKLAEFYEMHPTNKTNYWAREQLMTNYLSELPDSIKDKLPVPIGFRSLHPEVRNRISTIFYAHPREGITYWDKVISVAHFIQTLVPEVVQFSVNTTLTLKGKYTRTQLKNLMTATEFGQMDALQRNRKISDEEREKEIGAIIRNVYHRSAAEGNTATWPPMYGFESLPPTVQNAVRHVWFEEERAMTDHNPLLSVYKNHIAPHVIPKEFVGKSGMLKVCGWVNETDAKGREAMDMINDLYVKHPEHFTYANVAENVHTAGPALQQENGATEKGAIVTLAPPTAHTFPALP